MVKKRAKKAIFAILLKFIILYLSFLRESNWPYPDGT